uniref:Uncharacterized protein n=1 Tax=Brassica oleracea var. oleracea TaxID=109376 RepID=A0A0D3A5T6_BRAOL
MRSGGESKGTVVGLFVVFVFVFVVMGSGEIDAGAAVEGGEESGDDRGAEPARCLIDLLHGSRRANVGAYADALVHDLPI